MSTPRTTGEWHLVLGVMPAGQWVTAREIADALGKGWAKTLVERRLYALESGGQVERLMDSKTTGKRGWAWRPKPGAWKPTVTAVAGPGVR